MSHLYSPHPPWALSPQHGALVYLLLLLVGLGCMHSIYPGRPGIWKMLQSPGLPAAVGRPGPHTFHHL